MSAEITTYVDELWLVSAGTTYSGDGEMIVGEDEFAEMTRVRDLKAVYRDHFGELRSVKAEVQYCQKLVDQCRLRLIQGELTQ